MMGISRIKIYESEMKVLADLHYFDNTKKTITWNIRKEREHHMCFADGYTLIEDTRIK